MPALALHAFIASRKCAPSTCCPTQWGSGSAASEQCEQSGRVEWGSWIPCRDMRSAGQSRRISWEFEIWLARTITSGQLANPGSCLPSPFAVVRREAISLRCAKKDSSAAARTIIPSYWVMSLHSILNFTLGNFFLHSKANPIYLFLCVSAAPAPGRMDSLMWRQKTPLCTSFT